MMTSTFSYLPRILRSNGQLGAVTICALAMLGGRAAASQKPDQVSVTVTPSAAGRQLVRVSLPFPRGLLGDRQGLIVSDGVASQSAGVRILTRYPVTGNEAPSARRALVTFPYSFADTHPVPFLLRAGRIGSARPRLPVRITSDGQTVTITYRNGPTLVARLIAPARTSGEPPMRETVESNAHYLWQRIRLGDGKWSRIIEIRADSLGGVAVVAHLQRHEAGDLRAPDLGWEIAIRTRSANLIRGDVAVRVTPAPVRHAFRDGQCDLRFDDGRFRLYHPTGPFRLRGGVEAHMAGVDSLAYRYLTCAADEKVPMQLSSWRRAEFVVSPSALAPLTPALLSPHEARPDWHLWDALYETGRPLQETLLDTGTGAAQDVRRELLALLRYHRDAIVRSAAVGDDWGNVTGFSDASPHGYIFGMNRLNHCLPIFEDGYRSDDRRLVETAVLWCDNFYDQSIWWGPKETGGTRYNNVAAGGGKPPDSAYMWRSDASVSFCTKGFDAFFVAFEETGDPRMWEALQAQVDYSEKFLDAGRDYCRNIGVARDFLRLYRYTGEARYVVQATRLFHDLRPLLSTGHLFTESGRPIEADPPFINDDQVGYKHPFAKPYILGYALEGLPDLALLTPDEPELKTLVRSVADFMAKSQDPLGGWRYPHPRSTYLILSQAIEHAWQLTQCDRAAGEVPAHLDAIERVLRQRLLGWRKTGATPGGVQGWEIVTGKIKQADEIYRLYSRPADRDSARDYVESRIDFGGSSPEGIVYLPDVLRFYLEHRPASRLAEPAAPTSPLGKMLSR